MMQLVLMAIDCEAIAIRARFVHAGSSITAVQPHNNRKRTYRRVALSASSCGRSGRVGHAEAIGGFAGRCVSEETKMSGAKCQALCDKPSGQLRPALSTTTATLYSHSSHSLDAARTLVETASSSTASLVLYHHYCRDLWGWSMLVTQESTRLATGSRHYCPAVAVVDV
jgi:hypothetical protein